MEKIEAAIEHGLNKKEIMQCVDMKSSNAALKFSSHTPSSLLDSSTSLTTETVTFDASGMLHDIFNQLTEYGVEMDTHVQTMKDHQLAFKKDLQQLIEVQKRNMEQKWEEYSLKTQKQTQALLESILEKQNNKAHQKESQQEILLALGKIQDDLEEQRFVSSDAFRKENNVLKKKVSDLSDSMETGFSMIKTNVLGLKESVRLMEKNIQRIRQELHQSLPDLESSLLIRNIGDETETRVKKSALVTNENNYQLLVDKIDNFLESAYRLPYKFFSCPNISIPVKNDDVSWFWHPLVLLVLSLIIGSYFYFYWSSSSYYSGSRSLWRKWFKWQ